MGSLTPCRVWGAPFRQSSSACRLESIDPFTFLDQGGRACHIESNRDAGSICACRPSPNWGSRVKNLATNPGCHGDNTRQTQTTIIRSVGKPETPVHGSLATMFVVSVQDTRPNSPCRMGIIRPTWRADDGSSPARGTSLWLAGTSLLWSSYSKTQM
jgi:hypothetical protein